MRPALRQSAAPILLALSMCLAGCGGARKSDGKARANQSVITAAQILEHRFTNGYEAVEALHSNWLRAKGTNSLQNPSEVRVYVDNTSLGGIETLKTVSAPTIRTIEHFDGIAATGRWGMDHGAGVILITTHR